MTTEPELMTDCRHYVEYATPESFICDYNGNDCTECNEDCLDYDELPFRLDRFDYLEYLQTAFDDTQLLDIIIRMMSDDMSAWMTDHICRDYDLQYPDKVTKDSLYPEMVTIK